MVQLKRTNKKVEAFSVNPIIMREVDRQIHFRGFKNRSQLVETLLLNWVAEYHSDDDEELFQE
jgi:metal-responsive CopG/Arc/MetJ family transcriptional regulator